MKKTSKIWAVVLAVVMIIAVVSVLASCGDDEQIVSYDWTIKAHAPGYLAQEPYHILVKVTVKGDKITNIDLTDYHMVSVNWDEGNVYTPQLKAWVDEYLVGQDVETVKSWKMRLVSGGEIFSADGRDLGFDVVTGATASSVYIVQAVCMALNNLKTK